MCENQPSNIDLADRVGQKEGLVKRLCVARESFVV